MYIIDLIKKIIWTLSILIYIWILPAILTYGGKFKTDIILSLWIKIFTESFFISILIAILWKEKYKKTCITVLIFSIFTFLPLLDNTSKILIWLYITSGTNLGIFLSDNDIPKDFIKWVKSLIYK